VRGHVTKNGSDVYGQASCYSATNASDSVNGISAWIPCSPGDYFEIVFENSAAVTLASAVQTWGCAEFRYVGAVYEDAVTETATATDSVGIQGIFGESVTEAATAADTVSALGNFSSVIEETVEALDTSGVSITYAAGVEESANATDIVDGRKFLLTWFLSFAQVTPPPELQGPGNPGKLFGDFHYTEEE